MVSKARAQLYHKSVPLLYRSSKKALSAQRVDGSTKTISIRRRLISTPLPSLNPLYSFVERRLYPGGTRRLSLALSICLLTLSIQTNSQWSCIKLATRCWVACDAKSSTFSNSATNPPSSVAGRRLLEIRKRIPNSCPGGESSVNGKPVPTCSPRTSARRRQHTF